MKIEGYHPPKSSFLSINKDMRLLVDKILSNERLKKLLYYTSRDALTKPKLSEEESISLFGKQIKLVPKLYVDGSVLTYIIISFDNFIESGNPEFRDNIIEFDIICHFDQWQLEDFQLRPYRIAAEIDTLFNNQRLTGIGTFQFLGCNQIILNDEFAGLTLMYSAIHGGEDKNYNKDQRDLLSPVEEQQYLEDFNKTFNNGRNVKW